jgi:phage shock protein C
MARRLKFYLDKRNGKLMGVCSGIADYVGIDATWVRAGLVLATILGAAPFTLIAYVIIGFVASDKPREFYDDTAEERRFWRDVRLSPPRSVADTHSRFRDIDRRLRDVETYVTSSNRGLAAEIDKLR